RDQHGRALARERERGGAPDAGGGPGHERRLARDEARAGPHCLGSRFRRHRVRSVRVRPLTVSLPVPDLKHVTFRSRARRGAASFAHRAAGAYPAPARGRETMLRILVRLVVGSIVVLLGIGALEIVAAESGEVVVLKTTDAAGATHETRLWIVDD